MMNRWVLAAALLSAFAVVAHAQSAAVEREIKAAPGKAVRVGVYTNILPDCTSGPLPSIRLVTPPAHGAVTVRRGTLKATNLKQCLATEVPVFVAIYRAAEGFNGSDEFVLEITAPGGRKTLQHIRVNVSDAAGGRGI